MNDERTENLRKLVDVIYQAYKTDPFFYDKFAWEIWANVAEQILYKEENKNK
jgi:hypothetical protein